MDLELLERIGLGELDEAAALEVVRASLGSEEPEVRRRAVLTAHERVMKALVPELTGRLEDASPRVREVAADALGFLHLFAGEAASAVLDPLEARLEDDVRPVRLAAVRALGLIGAPSSQAALVAMASTAEPEESRAAREALAVARMEALAPVVPVPRADDLALEVRRDDAASPPAVEALLSAGPGALPVLARLLGEPGARRHVLETLARTGATPLVPELVEVATHADPHDRALAARALARSGPDAIPALLDLLDRGAPSVRAALIEALPAAPETLGVLARALEDDNPELRARAVARAPEWGDLGRSLLA